eukprot:jgi/Chlat1/7910/Chrsp68S07352
MSQYDDWFELADGDADGRVTGQDAIQFFARSQLRRETLAKIWVMADASRSGFLDKRAFARAMRLISLAQAGEEITPENILAKEASWTKPPQMLGVDELERALAGKRAQEAYGLANPFANDAPAADGNPSASVRALPKVPTEAINWKPPPKGKRGYIPAKVCTSVVDGLKRLYFEKVRPLEVMYKFSDFHSPLLAESDFDAKPTVLLLGQYSTGKTTFIRHLLGRDYPGAHIGPEPTTDRFVVIYGGHEERITPGNTLAVQSDKPFTGLTSFGTGFLSKFEGSQLPNSLLEDITLVDTPGVLSGEKQRIERAYDFAAICEWWAQRSDLILLLFDPHKLDISDEFKRVIMTLKGHDDKIRVVLNKADQVGTQQLMRVYGALMWSLGKVLNTPEVVRVYIGSFNAKPLPPDNQREDAIGTQLFIKEQDDLLRDLKDIPKRSCDRKVNEFVKRVRAAKIHAFIISHLRKEMPSMMGKKKAQDRLIDNLEDEFFKVQKETHFPVGDFPNVEKFRRIAAGYDLSNFPKISSKMIKAVDEVLQNDIPDLLRTFQNPYE